MNERTVELFEYASRKKLRFETNRGMITVEDLWDMPLTHKSAYDLDNTAKSINRELKATVEESFVNTVGNKRKTELEVKLDIVKFVIATLQKEKQDADARAGRKAEKEMLVAALESKKQENMRGMTEDQLKARIAELEA